MNRSKIFNEICNILTQYSKSELTADEMKMETTITDDLSIYSARLVDILLDFEDTFEIEVDDESFDKVVSIGDAVELVQAKLTAKSEG